MIVILPDSNAFTQAETLNWVTLIRGSNSQLQDSGQSVESAIWIAITGNALSKKNGTSIVLSDDCLPYSEPGRTTLYGQRSMPADAARNAAYLATPRADHLRQHTNALDGKAA